MQGLTNPSPGSYNKRENSAAIGLIYDKLNTFIKFEQTMVK